MSAYKRRTHTHIHVFLQRIAVLARASFLAIFSPHMIPNTSTQLLLCNCVLVSLCVCGQGCLFSEADGDGARKKRGVFGILLWRSLYFMSLQIGAFGSFLSRSYIHGSRSVLFPFRHSLFLPLGAENHDSRTFLFACVTAHDPNCARTYVSSSELERERER